GFLGSLSAVAGVAGVLAHRYLLRKLSVKTMVNLSLALGVGSTLLYLLLHDEVSAIAINLVAGAVSAITVIVAATLAVNFSPPRSEAFSLAILATVENVAIRGADISGSYLYDHFFAQQLAPLVLISAAATALAFVFVPLLRLGGTSQGEPALW